MTQQQQPAFFTSWVQMEQIADTQPAELIDGFISSSSVVVLAGAPATGKSFTALSWAAAIAEGSQWFGRATRKTPVVYVLGEGYVGFGKRLEAWESVNGGRKPDDLHFMDGLTYGVSLKDPAAVQQLINTLAYVQPGLVIFDTFPMLSGMTNENDNSEVAQVMANVNKIVQDTGATVILIHYTTESSASSFVGTADTVVAAAEDTRENATGTFLLSTSVDHGGKQRNGEALTLYGFKIDSPGVLSRYGNSSTAYPDSNTQLREG